MARKITAIPGLLGEEPPAPVRAGEKPRAVRSVGQRPEHQDEAETTSERSERLVRSTLDLPSERHAELLRYAADAGAEVGWSVRPQFALRALVDLLLDDPEVAAAVRERIRAQGRPSRRKSS